MIFRVGAERSRRRSVHKVHDCGENREGNNPENSGVKGISKLFCPITERVSLLNDFKNHKNSIGTSVRSF
ncbi:MAG: hypothetical protein U1E78_05160 [Gammaproteobacteria bacterium]